MNELNKSPQARQYQSCQPQNKKSPRTGKGGKKLKIFRIRLFKLLYLTRQPQDITAS